MTRVQSLAGEFARRGFDSPSAAVTLWSRWLESDASELPISPDSFLVAADRDQALEIICELGDRHLPELRQVAEEPSWLSRVIRVAGASNVLGKFLAKHPEELKLLREPWRPRSTSYWHDFVAARVTVIDGVAEDAAGALRRANHAALLRIAAWDLESDDPAAVVDLVAGQLSYLADAILEHALACARAEVPDWQAARLAVLAMGKTGAEELNYISDVDVIYVCEPVGDASNDRAQQVGTQLAAALARICSAHSIDGSIWQVDAGLRPEGNAGPLVRSLESCRIYYEKWAKNWEFQALLKARPAAGDKELGKQFVDLVSPLVWQAAARDEFLPEVRAMRQRVISLIPPKDAGKEIKLSAGGLRDTEFSVQLLQLVHGRADDRLRRRGTFEALEQLVSYGYIGRADGAEMAQAYRLQRVLEHRVQLRRLRRTHLLPTDEPAAMTQLARGLATDPEQLVKDWRASSRQVLRLQQRIFFSPLLDAVSGISAEGLKLSTDAAQTRMRALGFNDPRTALGHIQALTKGASRTVEIQRQLMPAMLGWFAEGPNPDFGLLAFRQLSEALGGTSWYLRALRDEGFMARRLARICSSSRYVVDLLKRAPEMVQMLANDEQVQPRSAAEIAEAMRRATNRQEDPNKAAASLRGLRRSELCRIAVSDVLTDLDSTGSWLSELASASIDAALNLARREISAPEVGVIAMGRWGGWEMNYSSDADLLYVIPDEADAEAISSATALVRRTAEILGKPGPDPALVLDSDLRPEGKGGPQVRTVASYAAYYRNWSDTWEAQALLRAAHGAGSRELTSRVLADVAEIRYPDGGLSDEQVRQIRRLKSRMEAERIPKGVSKERHLKLGKGGLSDVEWTVQLLQLQHANQHPELRTTSTLGALAALERVGLLTTEQVEDLRGAWLQASRLRNSIMLVRGRASDALPTDIRELAAVAELLGYGSGHSSQLLEDTKRHTRRAGRVVDEVFWGE